MSAWQRVLAGQSRLRNNINTLSMITVWLFSPALAVIWLKHPNNNGSNNLSYLKSSGLFFPTNNTDIFNCHLLSKINLWWKWRPPRTKDLEMKGIHVKSKISSLEIFTSIVEPIKNLISHIKMRIDIMLDLEFRKFQRYKEIFRKSTNEFTGFSFNFPRRILE